MTEYRVISEKRDLPSIIGSEQGGYVTLEFFPQYRNVITTKENRDGGWMFCRDHLCYCDLDSAYAYIERVKEVAEYGRQIHPYPAK